MAFDAHKNLAISSIAVAPSPATSGTTFSVPVGEGARFATPPFNATVWPKEMPSPLNAEIVRVTAIVGDTFTVIRQQEETLTRAIVAGDLIVATVTAKMLADIESGVNFPVIATETFRLGTHRPEFYPHVQLLEIGDYYHAPANWTHVKDEWEYGIAIWPTMDVNENDPESGAQAVDCALYVHGAASIGYAFGLTGRVTQMGPGTIDIAYGVSGFVGYLASAAGRVNRAACFHGGWLVVGEVSARGVEIESLAGPAENTAFWTDQVAGPQNYAFRSVGTAKSEFGGDLSVVGRILKPIRQGHTWGLVGDLSGLATLPSMFVPTIGTQVSKIVGLRAKIASGTSVGVQVQRNGVNVGSVITVTPTAATTVFDVTLANDDEVSLVLSAPVGAPMTLSATLSLEHTL